MDNLEFPNLLHLFFFLDCRTKPESREGTHADTETQLTKLYHMQEACEDENVNKNRLLMFMNGPVGRRKLLEVILLLCASFTAPVRHKNFPAEHVDGL